MSHSYSVCQDELLISPRPCSCSPCFEAPIDYSSLSKRIVKELKLIISRFLRYYCMQALWQSVRYIHWRRPVSCTL
jgi:hypothetical protein